MDESGPRREYPKNLSSYREDAPGNLQQRRSMISAEPTDLPNSEMFSSIRRLSARVNCPAFSAQGPDRLAFPITTETAASRPSL
jgi:hypothetical protein